MTNTAHDSANGMMIHELSVTFHLPEGDVCAVDNVSACFPEGKITGLIGESGCGKSVLGLSVLGLLPSYASVRGKILLEGNLMEARTARRSLGTVIGLIPQNPSDSLNPSRTVKAHLQEALLPLRLSRKQRDEKASELLAAFGFSDPQRILRSYPHELSGGMQQRVLCAIGSACSPRWILADEPTKGLDRDLRSQVQDTLLAMRTQGVESMLIITHDLPLARAVCDTIAVMYAGQIAEFGPDVLQRPLHPYTQAFLAALPENGFQSIPGVAPAAGVRLPGCPFAPRCSVAEPRCHRELPPVCSPDSGRIVRCFQYV